MAVAKQSSNQAAVTRELKQRVLSCLNKLSDRDTHSAAASELESIAKNLSHDSVPPFLSSISATDSSDKSPVRKQCVRLISLLSETHGDALSPYLSKLLSAVIRRLRDPDSAIRSACVNAIASISSHITKPPFTSIIKPLVDALATEQDQNSQIGAALCLSSAIDASPDPEPLYLRRLMPRLDKLLKCESFKAKPALLTVIGSVIGAGVDFSQQALTNLVQCLVEFLSSEDWAARKASTEALLKLAVLRKDMLSEFKAPCLNTFQTKKFDKVKVVRESMNQMVEAWKEIPDVANEVSPPPQSHTHSSSRDVASDGHYPPASKASPTITSGTQIRNKSTSCLPDSRDKRTGPAMFRKLDHNKPADWKISIPAPRADSMNVVSAADLKGRDEKVLDKGAKANERFKKAETKRPLFSESSKEKMNDFGGYKAGFRMVPCHDDMSGCTGVGSNVAEDLYRKNKKESEDLSLIRKQLAQIENQQSSLLDLLQGFIGSSQNGMHLLESRVHNLELALDGISYDLAVSTGRMSNNDSEGAMCCKLPGAEFFSSKLWRKTGAQYSTARFSSSRGTIATHHMADKNVNTEVFKRENRKFRVQDGGGFTVNPLAEVQGDSHGISSEISSNRVSKNVHNAV